MPERSVQFADFLRSNDQLKIYRNQENDWINSYRTHECLEKGQEHQQYRRHSRMDTSRKIYRIQEDQGKKGQTRDGLEIKYQTQPCQTQHCQIHLCQTQNFLLLGTQEEIYLIRAGQERKGKWTTFRIREDLEVKRQTQFCRTTVYQIQLCHIQACRIPDRWKTRKDRR